MTNIHPVGLSGLGIAFRLWSYHILPGEERRGEGKGRREEGGGRGRLRHKTSDDITANYFIQYTGMRYPCEGYGGTPVRAMEVPL